MWAAAAASLSTVRNDERQREIVCRGCLFGTNKLKAQALKTQEFDLQLMFIYIVMRNVGCVTDDLTEMRICRKAQLNNMS